MNTIISFLIENILLFVLLFVGVWLLKRVFAKQLSATMHYLIWGIVILKLLLPMTMPSNLSPLNLFPQPDTTAAVQTAQRIPEDLPQIAAVSESESQPSDVQTTQPQTTAETEHKADAKTVMINRPHIDWTFVVWMVWVGGVLGFGIWMMTGAARLKRLKAVQDNVPAWIKTQFESCRKRMSIKKPIQIRLQTNLTIPAITGIWNPKLFLPATLAEERDEEKLRHIFFHELSHYKRGDIVVTYLLNVLNAFYWFNPLVWLTVKLINKDMETACDATVLRYLGLENRRGYIETIIEFAGNSDGRRYQPLLCMNDGRMKMKNRIKGMFLKKRTKATVKIPVLLLAAVLAVLCFTTACQPTPEEPVVMNKNANLAEDVLAAVEEEEPAALEEDKQVIAEQIKQVNGHMDMEITPNDDVTIKVDADIVASEYDQIPLIRVRPQNFSADQFDTFADVLTGGLPLYVETWDDQNGNSRSKEEITAQLALMKSYLANDDLPDHLRSAWEWRVNDLQECLDSAISQADEQPYDGTPTPAESNSLYNSITSLKCYMDKSLAATLNLWQSNEGNETQMAFFNTDGVSAYNTYEPYEGEDASRMQMTYEQAKAKVMDYVHTVDGEDSNLVICDSSIAYQIDTLPNYTMETSPQAYMFNLARCYNGVAVKSVSHLWGFSETIDYSKRVSPESMMVIIDDSGIVHVGWVNHMEYVEDVTGDVPMMDFESVKEIFEDYCRYKFAWTYRNDALEGDTTPPVTLNVKKVELNVMVIPEKDSLKSYITVPVWDFIADMTLEGDSMTQEGSIDQGQKNVSILTINAINGTVIDRQQGY